jgi:hypothetical protein
VYYMRITIVPGDWNGDGKVDAADYVTWRNNPAANGGNPAGYDTWRANFGRGSGGASLSTATIVPEANAALLAWAMLFCAAGPCRKRK